MKRPLLSILICSLLKRKELLYRLLTQFKKQTENLENVVEILIETDNGEKTTGEKRNILLRKARGEYIVYIDDDDLIPEYYVKEVLQAIQTKPDAIGYIIEVSLANNKKRLSYHSLKNKTRYMKNNTWYRPIEHINPIKKSLIGCEKFLNITVGEDHKFIDKISNNLKTEVFIDKVMYYYYPSIPCKK